MSQIKIPARAIGFAALYYGAVCHHHGEDFMNSNKTFTELMCEVSELIFTLGPRDTIKTMQRVLLDMAPSRANVVPDRKEICAAEAPAGGMTPNAAASRTSRRMPSSWRYRKTDGVATIRDKQLDQTDLSRHGNFLDGSITNDAGTRSYKLYVPSCYHGQPLPLVVMLHGCTQDPDDFAVGTRMNMIAEEKHCFVVYPAQAKSASRPKCWNWFDAANQQREQGEPSLIADITREIIRTYHVDERMVYIAGLSAGGAMAAIMAMTYPDLFAAAGVHSGLPWNVASDWYSALSAMKNGPNPYRRESAAASDIAERLRTVPMIVFHGDADTVVHPSNGDHVLKQAVSPCCAETSDTEVNPLTATSVIQDELAEGRSYTRTVYQDESGQSMAEQWLIHGAGHAWSGGSDDGSYTDPLGPDAALEMMRFFYEQSQPK
jgi:poly(hydroxyalkanoate) depolymerase family esterase